jgi:hypothetical protein
MAIPEHCYIGRRGVVFVPSGTDADALTPHIRRPPQDSPWTNPHKIRPGFDRAAVVAAYEADMRRRLSGAGPAADALRASLRMLKGKLLGCWCAPAACHGDVLAQLVAELDA